MKFRRAVLALGAVLLLGACEGSVTEAGLRPGEGASLDAAGGGGDFYVALIGKMKVDTESTQNYRAEINGGTAPYYYYWTEQVCWDYGTCNTYFIASGWGLSSINHLIRDEMVSVRLDVQVKDSQGNYGTGNRAIDIIAPASFGVLENSQFACNPRPNWYPVSDALGPYVRSSCDGSKLRP